MQWLLLAFSENSPSILEQLFCAGLMPGVQRQIIHGPAFQELTFSGGGGGKQKASKEIIPALKEIPIVYSGPGVGQGGGR